MLIAKDATVPASAREMVLRLEAKLRQAAATNPDKELLPSASWRHVWSILLSLALLIASLGCWVAFLFGGSWFESAAVRLGFAGLGLLLGLGNRLVERAERRRLRALNEGVEVGLGALVHAHEKLFDPANEEPAFGLAVVTFDPALQEDPKPMIELARQIFARKEEGSAPPPEDLRAAVERTRTEKVSIEQRMRLPRSLTGNDRTFLLDLLFEPSTLPRGWVDRRLWPVVLHRDNTSIAVQVPDRALWWSPELDRALAPLLLGVEANESEHEHEHGAGAEAPPP